MPNDNDDKVTLHWEVICRVLNPDEREPLHSPLQTHSGTGPTLGDAIVVFKHKFDDARDLTRLTYARREQERACIMLDVNEAILALDQLDREEEDPDAKV